MFGAEDRWLGLGSVPAEFQRRNIPILKGQPRLLQVVAGDARTCLARSGGSDVACVRNDTKPTNFPATDGQLCLSQVAAGDGCTFLVRSDGSDAACEHNGEIIVVAAVALSDSIPDRCQQILRPRPPRMPPQTRTVTGLSTAGAQHPAACRSASPLCFFHGNDASHEGLGDADSAEAIAEKPDVDISAMLWPAPTDATAAILMALAASPDPRRRQICELLQTFTSQQGHIYIYIYILVISGISYSILHRIWGFWYC